MKNIFRAHTEELVLLTMMIAIGGLIWFEYDYLVFLVESLLNWVLGIVASIVGIIMVVKLVFGSIKGAAIDHKENSYYASQARKANDDYYYYKNRAAKANNGYDKKRFAQSQENARRKREAARHNRDYY